MKICDIKKRWLRGDKWSGAYPLFVITFPIQFLGLNFADTQHTRKSLRDYMLSK